MTNRVSAFIVFAITAIVCVTADLASKYAVFAHLGFESQDPLVLIPGWLQFNTAINQGGMWSLGAAFGQSMNFWLAAFASTAAIVITAWAWFTIQPGQIALPIVLGAILGGALGNLYDRVVFAGVRDFIQVHYQHLWYFPTFNIADSCLVCGAIVLILASFFTTNQSETDSSEIRTAPKQMTAS